MDMVELPSEEIRQMLAGFPARVSRRAMARGRQAGDTRRSFGDLDQARRAGRRLARSRLRRGWPSRDFGGDGRTWPAPRVRRRCGRPHSPIWRCRVLQADAAVDLLEKLHAGTARVAFSFGALDPDRHAGSVRLETDRRADYFASSRWRTVAHISSWPSIRSCARGGRAGRGRCRSRTHPGVGRLGSA